MYQPKWIFLHSANMGHVHKKAEGAMDTVRIKMKSRVVKVKQTCWNVPTRRQEALLNDFITTLGIIDFTQCAENIRFVMCNICIERPALLLSEKCKAEVKSNDPKSLISNRLAFELSSRLCFNRSGHFGCTFSINCTGWNRVSKKSSVYPTFWIIEYRNY